MRTMYDSVTASEIPRDAQLVAGYVNGPYKWSDTDWALFPNAVHVGIAVRPSFDGGDVLDVEPGDSTPAQAPGWVTMRRARGVDPSIYCNLSTWPDVVSEFARQGVAAPHYWIAHYDGKTEIPPGAIAKQHTNTAGWDLSSVVDYWPGIDKEDIMALSAEDINAIAAAVARIGVHNESNGKTDPLVENLRWTLFAGDRANGALNNIVSRLDALSAKVDALAVHSGGVTGPVNVSGTLNVTQP